ncbi:MAG: HEPN domain-containing protein [Desulfobacterales bacterium]|nr:HEPN domain-containing protein [Deltaproteobacteria bacterium]NNL77616.1 HEPN domain-containing protein [Desulfobacterales bacterium]
MKEEREALIAYRLEQADESIESAQILLEHEKYRPSVSRSYYSMFYCVQALLSKEEISTSKHSGAIAAFNREFVKKGIIDKDFSRWLQEAFDLRQRADYREMFTVSYERAKTVLDHAQAFVKEIKRQIGIKYIV